MLPRDLSISDTGLASSWKMNKRFPVPPILGNTSTNPNVLFPNKWNTDSRAVKIFTNFPSKIIF